MTDGGVGPPIPSVTDDGWGVSQDPSVSVIRPRIGPLCFFILLKINQEINNKKWKIKMEEAFQMDVEAR
jgi:hypothetical protein